MRTSKFFFASVLICVISTSVVAQEREWTSANGKFTITGKLVETLDGEVKIERSNGKVISVDLKKLSDADQTFLKSLSTAEDAKAEPAKKEAKAPKVKARVQWSKFPTFQDGKEEPLDLELLIEAIGPEARNAIYYGMLKIKKLEADGKTIEPQEDEFRSGDQTKEFVLVKRSENEFFNEHPKDGVRAKLTFDHPETKLKEFTSVEGEFKIRTGGSRRVAKLPVRLGKDIVSEELKDLGVEVEISQDDATLNIELSGDLTSVYDVKLMDAKGEKPDKLSGNGWSGSGQSKSYQFFFDDKSAISEDMVFQISIAEDLEEMTIPFNLKEIRVPKEESPATSNRFGF